MRTFAALVFLSAGLAFAQQSEQPMSMPHADQVMGFSQAKTTHHFGLTADGGYIDVRSNDIADVTSREQIQKHLHHIVQMFAAGNFSAPMLVHDPKNVPGTATMTALKDKLHWELADTPRGARLTVVADNQAALDAVHDFLRFQIEDHHTGDCEAVR